MMTAMSFKTTGIANTKLMESEDSRNIEDSDIEAK
jgi:hypothetical protein